MRSSITRSNFPLRPVREAAEFLVLLPRPCARALARDTGKAKSYHSAGYFMADHLCT